MVRAAFLFGVHLLTIQVNMGLKLWEWNNVKIVTGEYSLSIEKEAGQLLQEGSKIQIVLSSEC
ncbi:hypothetical protein J2T20_000377 [Paenibacillus wynnii]|nr:hypothetical protein [Paenibacillus wynnii]